MQGALELNLLGARYEIGNRDEELVGQLRPTESPRASFVDGDLPEHHRSQRVRDLLFQRSV